LREVNYFHPVNLYSSSSLRLHCSCSTVYIQVLAVTDSPPSDFIDGLDTIDCSID